MPTGTRPPRGTAEWVTFAVATAVLLAIVALIVFQVGGVGDPAAPVATIDGPVTESNGQWTVPVRVENDGDVTASAVQVQAELTVGTETMSADQTIDFLPAGDSEDLVFTFDTDPAEGELVVRVASYGLP